MGNYVIGAGNYVIATPSELGNYLSADSRSGLMCTGTPARRCGAIRHCQLTAFGTRVRAAQVGILAPAARPENEEPGGLL